MSKYQISIISVRADVATERCYSYNYKYFEVLYHTAAVYNIFGVLYSFVALFSLNSSYEVPAIT